MRVFRCDASTQHTSASHGMLFSRAFSLASYLTWCLVTVDISTVGPVLEPIHVLPVCVDLGGHGFVRISADSAAKWGILHHGQVIENLGCLRWIAGLCVVPALCVFFWIDVVVRIVLDFAELHAATRPVSPEAARLDACQLDAPLGLQLLRQGFCESFYCPLGSAVDGERGYTYFVSLFYLSPNKSDSPIWPPTEVTC